MKSIKYVKSMSKQCSLSKDYLQQLNFQFASEVASVHMLLYICMLMILIVLL